LWSAGKTADAIGADLGGISRSAVLGKIFRLRLVVADEAPPDTPARRRAGKAKPIQPQPAKHKSLLELTNECCRWQHGELGGRRFFFCGVPEADLARGIPYCPRHMKRAYLIPPSLITPLHKLKLIAGGGLNKRGRGAKKSKPTSSLSRPGRRDSGPVVAPRENNTKRHFG
jgi:GcrA cell cycle regulator